MLSSSIGIREFKRIEELATRPGKVNPVWKTCKGISFYLKNLVFLLWMIKIGNPGILIVTINVTQIAVVKIILPVVL